MERTVRVMLCVNDERGNPSGHLHALAIEDHLFGVVLDFEGADMRWNGPVFRHIGDQVHVGRHTYSIRSYGRYAGNFSWDSVTLRHSVALELLRGLVEVGFKHVGVTFVEEYRELLEAAGVPWHAQALSA